MLRIRRSLFLLTTLLALLSQSVAGVMMNCQSGDNSHSMMLSQSSTTMTSMAMSAEHSQHMAHKKVISENNSEDSDPTGVMNCCDSDCLCPVSGCNSIALLSDSSLAPVAPQNSYLPIFVGQHPIQTVDKLYRPPILA